MNKKTKSYIDRFYSNKKSSLSKGIQKSIIKDIKQDTIIDASEGFLSLIEKNRNTCEKYRNIHLIFGAIITSTLYILNLEFLDIVLLIKSIEVLYPLIFIPLGIIIFFSYIYDYYAHRAWIKAKVSKKIWASRINNIETFSGILVFFNITIYIWIFFILFFIYAEFTSIFYHYSNKEDILLKIQNYYTKNHVLPLNTKFLNISDKIIQNYQYLNYSNYYVIIYKDELFFTKEGYNTNYYMIENDEIIEVDNYNLISNNTFQ